MVACQTIEFDMDPTNEAEHDKTNQLQMLCVVSNQNEQRPQDCY